VTEERRNRGRENRLIWSVGAMVAVVAFAVAYGPEIARMAHGDFSCKTDGTDHSMCRGPDEQIPGTGSSDH